VAGKPADRRGGAHIEGLGIARQFMVVDCSVRGSGLGRLVNVVDFALVLVLIVISNVIMCGEAE
jgi:hypothetical protein